MRQTFIIIFSSLLNIRSLQNKFLSHKTMYIKLGRMYIEKLGRMHIENTLIIISFRIYIRTVSVLQENLPLSCLNSLSKHNWISPGLYEV